MIEVELLLCARNAAALANARTANRTAVRRNFNPLKFIVHSVSSIPPLKSCASDLAGFFLNARKVSGVVMSRTIARSFTFGRTLAQAVGDDQTRRKRTPVQHSSSPGFRPKEEFIGESARTTKN